MALKLKNDETYEGRIGPQVEVLQGMGDVVSKNLNLLAPVDKAWQPTDYLPDLTGEDWAAKLKEFREPARSLTDETLVVLVGDMVTEEALPNYAISLNLIARDYVGTSDTPWARWMRGWVAEENRHGDLLNAFLRLTGRVDMRAVEITVHNLIANGFNPQAYPDPYAGLVYTAFQERATKISHMRVGKIARSEGNAHLGQICARIAGDESRHEHFYTRMAHEVIKQDPATMIPIVRDLLRRIIAMPGKLMCDGKDPDLFDHFASVAQRLGVYTVHDYADIVRHLMSTWDIANQKLSGKAAACQDFLCSHAERLESFADEITQRVALLPRTEFSWIFGRTA